MTALALLGTGCLPRGAPPAGQQIIADRQASLVGMVPPDGDGMLRLLVTHPGAEVGALDLYVAAVGASGGPPTETLLVPDYDIVDGLGCNYKVAPCSSVLARSLWAHQTTGAFVWVNPVTGYRLDLPQYPMLMSPSGERIFNFDSGLGTQAGSGRLDDADGTSIALDDVAYPVFSAGDDFYYSTQEGDLMRIPLSGAAEKVTTGLVASSPGASQVAVPGLYSLAPFAVVPTPDGMLLFLRRATSASAASQLFVRDPLSGAETALPFDAPGVPLVSTDGRWLVDASEGSGGRLTFFDYRANDTEVVDFGVPVFSGEWRPQHSDFWAASRTWNADATVETVIQWILSPTAAPIMVPNLDTAVPTFTPDGSYWLSTPDFDMTKSRVQVGPADDPNGPKFQLNPANTSADPIWILDDDRLVASVYTKDTDIEARTDAIVLDPRTGDSLVLGERGWLAAVGQTRVLGLFHSDEMRGDLTVSEIDTGRQTVLAPEFAVTAFAEPQGADQLAPGTRIAYQFQARTDSPYDGIWVATCP
ncbi:MAG TPA: hypothetical protein VMT03_15130 [Polyangia bacterium]|nr:hypothetical protein [Polyangia bacterium]